MDIPGESRTGFSKTPTARANCLAFYFFPRRTSASLRSSGVDPRLDWTDFWEIPATDHCKVFQWKMRVVIRCDVIALRFRIPRNFYNSGKLIRENYRISTCQDICVTSLSLNKNLETTDCRDPGIGHSDIHVSERINKPTVSSSATSRRPIDRRGVIHARNEKRASGRIDLAGFDSGAQYRNSHSIAPNSFLRPRQSPLRHNKFMVPFRARTHTHT